MPTLRTMKCCTRLGVVWVITTTALLVFKLLPLPTVLGICFHQYTPLKEPWSWVWLVARPAVRTRHWPDKTWKLSAPVLLRNMKSKKLLVLLVAVCALLQRTRGGAKHKWPLTKQTILLDESNDGTASDSFLVNSSRCPLFGPDSRFNEDGAFFFNGTGSSLTNLRIKVPDSLSTFSFTFWLKPSLCALTTTNVIFEYRADAETNTTISRVRGELITGGRVNVTVGTPAQTFAIQSTASLSSSNFSLLFLAFKSNTLDLQVDTSQPVSQNIGLGSLYCPGNLRLGYSWSPGEPAFTGQINCVCLFDFHVINGPPSDYECTKLFSSGDQGCPRIAVAPDICPIDQRVPAFLSQLQYLWPLNAVTRDSQVLTDVSPLTPLHNAACLRTAVDSNLQQNPPLHFDGSWDSTVEMAANSSIWDDKFTVVLFVRPQQPPEGLLWDYSNSGSAVTGLSQVQVAAYSNGSLGVSMWDAGSTVACGQLTVADVLNTSKGFTMVTVVRDGQETRIQVDANKTWTTVDSCSTTPDRNNSTGWIRLAGRLLGYTAGFRGSLTCMAIFSENILHNAPTAAELLSLCDSYNSTWLLNHTVTPCVKTSADQTRSERYQLLASNLQPDPASLVPLASYTPTSRVQCAHLCLQTPHCTSFFLQPSSLCRLYDLVTLTALLPVTPATYSHGKYYEVTRNY